MGNAVSRPAVHCHREILGHHGLCGDGGRLHGGVDEPCRHEQRVHGPLRPDTAEQLAHFVPNGDAIADANCSNDFPDSITLWITQSGPYLLPEPFASRCPQRFSDFCPEHITNDGLSVIVSDCGARLWPAPTTCNAAPCESTQSADTLGAAKPTSAPAIPSASGVLCGI